LLDFGCQPPLQSNYYLLAFGPGGFRFCAGDNGFDLKRVLGLGIDFSKLLIFYVGYQVRF